MEKLASDAAAHRLGSCLVKPAFTPNVQAQKLQLSYFLSFDSLLKLHPSRFLCKNPAVISPWMRKYVGSRESMWAAVNSAVRSLTVLVKKIFENRKNKTQLSQVCCLDKMNEYITELWDMFLFSLLSTNPKPSVVVSQYLLTSLLCLWLSAPNTLVPTEAVKL